MKRHILIPFRLSELKSREHGQKTKPKHTVERSCRKPHSQNTQKKSHTPIPCGINNIRQHRNLVLRSTPTWRRKKKCQRILSLPYTRVIRMPTPAVVSQQWAKTSEMGENKEPFSVKAVCVLHRRLQTLEIHPLKCSITLFSPLFLFAPGLFLDPGRKWPTLLFHSVNTPKHARRI